VGLIFARGPGHLIQIHGIMNSIKYQQIKNQNLTTSARYLQTSARYLITGHAQVFYQESDPKTNYKIKMKNWPMTTNFFDFFKQNIKRINNADYFLQPSLIIYTFFFQINPNLHLFFVSSILSNTVVRFMKKWLVLVN